MLVRTGRRKENRGRRRRRRSRAWCQAALVSGPRMAAALSWTSLEFILDTHNARAHTHTPDPLTSSNLLYSQKSSLSVPVPFHAQILGVLFLWASPELGTDSSPAPKPLSMAVESPKHRTHPVREEMQATWGIGSLWRMISCPRPSWVVIFDDVKLMQKKLWDPCCRPLLHTANYAGLFAVLSGSVMSNYAMKS